MKIDRKLLERYELGHCTEQERIVVQQWLAEDQGWDSTSEHRQLPNDSIRDGVWGRIENHIYTSEIPSSSRSFGSKPILKSVLYIAASLLVILGVSFLVNTIQNKQEVENFYAKNTGPTLEWYNDKNFDIALSDNSSANLDFMSGKIAVSGGALLKPKRSFVLQYTDNKSVHFEKGKVYILSELPNKQSFLVLRQSELLFLPPIMQQQLKKQFNIS